MGDSQSPATCCQPGKKHQLFEVRPQWLSGHVLGEGSHISALEQQPGSVVNGTPWGRAMASSILETSVSGRGQHPGGKIAPSFHTHHQLMQGPTQLGAKSSTNSTRWRGLCQWGLSELQGSPGPSAS